tara:strand:- start:13 stop:231 length:219 start_codon:yes stop_codon:yes gene_type:complete
LFSAAIAFLLASISEDSNVLFSLLLPICSPAFFSKLVSWSVALFSATCSMSSFFSVSFFSSSFDSGIFLAIL